MQDGPGSDPGAGLPRVQVDAAGPAHVPGPLGRDYIPGVHDPGGQFLPKEREIAEKIVTDRPGARVDPVPRVQDPPGLRTPDAIVRTDADDPGTATEFKTVDEPTNTAVKRSILDAGDQLHQTGNDATLGRGGDVYVDGRAAGLTEDEARRGYARAVGDARVNGTPLPDRVRVVLGDGTTIEM